MAERKRALAGMLEATKEASKKFRKKDLSMASSLIAGAASAKARDDYHGTTAGPNGTRVPKTETSQRDKDAARILAKRRTRRS